ncbi:hypothetical protein JCGZ_15893 [Jatropha curcas]|uniref:Uncharacterized protein n=1 Tax=Jatropha curcas TaxID=180498 RepID=A0A067KZ50_JATCU|nr:hypothetical protein JCGZ_15893 [Jatropha curcas]
MIEKSKKPKKGIISEEDISTLLQRYTANTVLALLQEVAQFEGVKIDWNELVKKTTTGISNVREYQMLWRHLAYRHALLDKLHDGAQPLDDDSDLEYELDVFPDVSTEASTEAAACVKVLIASGLPSDSTHPNSTTVEAPLTINIPNGKPCRFTSENLQPAIMKGVNITVPVSVQKQPLPAVTSAEGLDANGSGSGVPRRKRKPWSDSEDLELIAAVQKYGEGNWANILRSEVKWDRTASQLSQRWAIIRKRQGTSNLGGNTSSVQLIEEQRAARHAMNMALDPPVKNTFTNSSGETSSAQHRFQYPFATKSSVMGTLVPGAKPQVKMSNLVKPDIGSDLVRAAAVAAGARIATQSDAANLLKAAQAKNAVHIMSSSGSSIKPALPAGSSGNPEAYPNVRAASLSTQAAASPSGAHPALGKACLPTTQQAPSTSGAALNLLSEQANTELPPKQDSDNAKHVETLSKDVAIEHGEEKSAVSQNQDAEVKTEVDVEQSNASPNLEVAESDKMDVLENQAEPHQNSKSDSIKGLSIVKDENRSAIRENGNSQIISAKLADLPSMETDECSEKVEAACEAATVT